VAAVLPLILLFGGRTVNLPKSSTSLVASSASSGGLEASDAHERRRRIRGAEGRSTRSLQGDEGGGCHTPKGGGAEHAVAGGREVGGVTDVAGAGGGERRGFRTLEGGWNAKRAQGACCLCVLCMHVCSSGDAQARSD
jgi:hypothetical protein